MNSFLQQLKQAVYTILKDWTSSRKLEVEYPMHHQMKKDRLRVPTYIRRHIPIFNLNIVVMKVIHQGFTKVKNDHTKIDGLIKVKLCILHMNSNEVFIITNWLIFRLLESLSRLEAINLKLSINLNSRFTLTSFLSSFTNLSTITYFVKEMQFSSLFGIQEISPSLFHNVLINR